MGFLNKILNSESSSNLEINNETYINQTTTFYRKKYECMEQKGCVIDWWEFRQSIDKGWPYPVATEAERKAIHSYDKHALRNHAIDISELLYKYSQGSLESNNESDCTVYKDEDKVDYWKTLLINGAEHGNRSFQAALVRESGIYNGVTSGWETLEEQNLFKEKYETQLIKDAEASDPQAMYAVAEFCLGNAEYGSHYRKALAESAMKAGVGDAAFLCAGIYQTDFYSKGISCSYNKVLQYYARGVECNNGAMLGLMQDHIADAYRGGEEDFPKDLNKAIYYYKLAAKNGSESAESTLHLMDQNPNLFK